MNYPYIIFTPEQEKLRVKLGTARRQLGKKYDRPDRNGSPPNEAEALRWDILGAGAELATCLMIRPRTWNYLQYGKLDHQPDFDGWIDAKGRAKNWQELAIGPRANPNWAYVLVLSEEHPKYYFPGFMMGYEIKQPQFWKTVRGYPPAFFVDKTLLHPIEELMQQMAVKRAA